MPLVFEDPLTIIPEINGEIFGNLEMDPSFPEIDPNFMKNSVWH